jgi:pimeloyl-ACP methyl ester carboxylesterase
MTRQIVYLHGFASSARSSKAVWFADRARDAGVGFVCPDLNLPDFGALTISRMLDDVERILGDLPDGPVALVGSSLGAIVALFAVHANPARATTGRIDRLVLLAPALNLVEGLEALFGPERLEEWRRTDSYEVFHFGDQRMRSLRFAFMEDVRRFDVDALDVSLPILVYQGRRDQLVDVPTVERWAAARPNVDLHLLDDDHQLLSSLPAMWAGMRRFLSLEA